MTTLLRTNEPAAPSSAPSSKKLGKADTVKLAIAAVLSTTAVMSNDAIAQVPRAEPVILASSNQTESKTQAPKTADEAIKALSQAGDILVSISGDTKGFKGKWDQIIEKLNLNPGHYQSSPELHIAFEAPTHPTLGSIVDPAVTNQEPQDITKLLGLE